MALVDVLPPSLTQHKAWLLWKFVQQDGGKKPLKMPIYANTGKWRKGTHGSREDRQQLVTFDAATKVKETSKKQYDGLGLALLPDWKLVAVDFDDCVGSGEVHPEVLRLVEGTYWEFSPSARGVRAFFEGHVRDAKCINKAFKAERGFGVEFFCSKGFVTVTGNVAPEIELVGADIIPMTNAIRELYDEAIGSRDADTDNDDQARVGMTDEEIARMLEEEWDADCDYETWLKVGMAIHHETHGEGFDLWNDWSSKGSSYPGEAECQYKWESFGRSGRRSHTTIRWMINEKGINFSLENAIVDGELGGKLAPLVDAEGKKVKSLKPSDLSVKGNGLIEPTMTNIRAALSAPGFCGWEFKKDTFVMQTLILPSEHGATWRELENEDYAALQSVLERKGFDRPPMDKIVDAVALVARDNEFNSARDWLNNVVPAWDGVERVKHFAKRFIGASNDEAYCEAVSLYAWTAHAGRVLEPGIKADMMPVLWGPENVGKSYNVRAIAPRMFDPVAGRASRARAVADDATKLFVSLKFSDDDKVNIEKTVGTLVVEFAEMDGIAKRDTSSIKDYISRQVEKYRFAYTRLPVTIARTFMMWGTSNEDRFLVSTTGNRRFLPLHALGVGEDESRYFTDADRDQHWAEARELFKANGIMCIKESNQLAEPYRKLAQKVDEWESDIVDFLENKKDDKGVPWGKRECISRNEVYIEALGVLSAQRNNKTQTRLNAVMKSLGYTEGQRRTSKGKKLRGFWKTPAEED